MASSQKQSNSSVTLENLSKDDRRKTKGWKLLVPQVTRGVSVPDVGAGHTTTTLDTQFNVAPELDTDKPLPTLPQKSPLPAPGENSAPGVADTSKPQRARTEIKLPFGPVVRWRKRRKAPKANQEIEIPAETQTQSLPGPRSTQVFYANKGTQTSPRLAATDKAQPRSSVWKLGLNHLTPSSSETRPYSSRGYQSPLWSPKRWSQVGPTDYFSLSSQVGRNTNQVTSPRPESSTELKGQDRGRDDGSGFEKTLSVSRNSINDSVGTYESRYSGHQEEPLTPRGDAVTKRAMSDSEVPRVMQTRQHASLNSSLSDDNATSHSPGSLNSSSSQASSGETVLKRPMPLPFQRTSQLYATPRSSKPKSSSSSQSGNVSPIFPDSPYRRNLRNSSSTTRSSLRQTYTASVEQDISNTDPEARDPKFFRAYVSVGPEESPATVGHIPDHLRSSPLCPRHPKHKSGGMGYCPLHGQNNGSSSDLAFSQGSSKDHPRRPYPVPTAQKAMVATIPDGAISYNLGLPDHAADDPDCPANMQAKGICLYHGRAFKLSSQESVSRSFGF